MNTEILYYKHIHDWELETLFTDELKDYVEPDYPLVVSTLSSFVSRNTCHRNYYTHNKRRGRPSEIRDAKVDWLVTLPGRLLGLRSDIVNVTAECSGGMYALYMATLISQARNKPVVVFCAENVLTADFETWCFNSVGALDPEGGRCFDSTSRGLRIGVGATVMIVKHPSVTNVKQSLAQCAPLAVAHSYNFYTNPELITSPGKVEDMIANVNNIDYSTVDLWNAHATGTPVGDAFEYDYFNTVIKQDIPIIGYKGYIGHCISASGPMEICEMFVDRENGMLRPNNITGPKIVEDSRIITEPTKFDYKRVLKTSFGFGGKSAICLIDLQ